MATSNNDIFKKPDVSVKPKQDGSENRLLKKADKIDLKKTVQEATKSKVTATGVNIRVSREIHGLVKAISTVENREMYTIVNNAIMLWLEQQPKSSQKEYWEKLQQLLDQRFITF
ncbi:hypothetical protein CKN63_13225 [Carnobacterium divergens]|uniref:hypothetical protein n=1 Tax=Carnobacterium divergens TaxID=2748 RepID=UPI001071B22F|nr:hypothetical protein [Carnobacterium divergens]TFI60522.1 hypothetical protein CKN59_13160 [Carnobacterium divergens]TFI61678.1 hypothetical protein CKN76_12825 [Carnobacterium divergens]TFJ00997.1 hypothetical protein CKN75_12750 [Carnobacterium divergens]TFJ08917.1 hypothetical protein CKN71_12765 [Carnobacterium divergens]TFJ15626.1 hypothetical protein CKN63_13225 [Carnobacterium divergens]